MGDSLVGLAAGVEAQARRRLQDKVFEELGKRVDAEAANGEQVTTRCHDSVA